MDIPQIPQPYTYKIEFSMFFLQISFFSDVLNSMFGSSNLPVSSQKI